MDMDKEKKKVKARAQNFTEKEQRILLNCVRKYTEFVECKRTDSVSNEQKLRYWQRITAEFNQQNDRSRELIILKNKWENLKKKTKKIISEEKTFRGSTGGGPPKYFNVTDIDLEIKEMLGKQVTGRKSYFDSEDHVEDHTLTCSEEGEENEVIVVQMENADEEIYEIPSEIEYEHHKSVNSDECNNGCHVEETVRTPNNLYLQKNKDILNETDVFRPGVNFAATTLRRPKSDALKVKNSQPENRAKKHDVLKTNLGKWTLSKTTLVETQKQHLDEEHQKKMEHMDKKQKLELEYMKEEHEAGMAKILKGGT